MWTWWMDRVGASAKPWHFFSVIKHHLSPKMRMWKLFTSNFISKTRDRILSVCVCLRAPCVFEWYEASLSGSAKDMEHSQHIKRMPVTFFCPILRETFSEGVWTQSYLQIGFRLLSQWFKLFHRNPRHVETKRLLHGCGYGQTFRVSRWRRKTTESHYVFKGLPGSFHSGGRCGLR